MASSLFNLIALQSFSTISKFSLVYLLAWHPRLHTLYISWIFFTQSLASFHSTCPHHHNLFCCSTKIMSSNPSFSVIPLLGSLSCILTPHVHLTILISARRSATTFSFLTGQVLLPCNILLRTDVLYSLSLAINDISLLVSNGTKHLSLFHPIWSLVSKAASASPSTLNVYICASCASYWIHATSTNKCLSLYSVHATLYFTTFPVYTTSDN